MIGAFKAGILGGSVKAPDVTYATFDPGQLGSGFSLSGGNLTATKSVAGHTACFLNTGKSAGRWAVEFLWSFTGNLTNGSNTIGISSSRALTTYLGADVYSETWWISTIEGHRVYNNTQSGNFWKNVSNQSNVSLLIVLDADNRVMYAADPTSGMKSAAIAITNTPIYFGLSMSVSSSTSATINTGQSAFTSANETLVQGLEASIGAINRGLWT